MINTLAHRSLVLTVAQESDMAGALWQRLEQEGYAVAKADSGSEAVDRYPGLHPDLILVDAALPNGDGIEVCARLQALSDSAHPPVILITGLDNDQGFVERAFAAGVVDIIDKPIQSYWPILARRIDYLIRTAQAEKKLQLERDQWHTVVDNLPDDIYVKDRQHRFVIANLAAVVVGLNSVDDLIGKTDFDVHPREMAEDFWADEEAIFESGQPLINREEMAPDPFTGKARVLLTTKMPLKDDAGQVIGLVGISRNITERKPEDETLERERALLRAIIDNVPDYIFAKDTAGRFVISNEAHARAANTSVEALVGKSATEVFPAHLAAQYDADDGAIMQSGQAMINAERVTVDAMGTERTVLTTKVPLKNSQGRVVGLAGISRDVTEAKRVEKALAEEHSLLLTLIDNLPDNVWVKDCQSRIVINNAAHRRQLGLATLEESVGKSDFDIFPNDLASRYYQDEQTVIQTGQPMINREEPALDSDHNWHWLLTTKVPLRDSQGDIIGVVGVNRDITDRKEAEQQALDLAMEREKVEALRSFIEDASHDLNTPITALSTGSYISRKLAEQMIKQTISLGSKTGTTTGAGRSGLIDEMSETAMKLYQQAVSQYKSAQRLRKTVADLIKMTQLDHRPDVELAAHDLFAVVSTIVELCTPLAADKQIPIRLEHENDLPFVKSDEDELGHAIQNIIENATRYTPPGGKITVEVYRQGKEVAVSVTDTGQGISEADLPHIFERFYRADKARATETGGTGLGLAITKKIVDAHRGRIEVKSTLGVGSTFTIFLSAQVL